MTNEDFQTQIDFLMRKAIYRCGSMDEARDLVQETMLAKLVFLEKGGRISDEKSWLVSVMNRKYYDTLRCKYQLPFVTIGEEMVLADEQNGIVKLQCSMEQREDAEEVRREVAYLSEKYRKVIVGYYFENKGIAELARQLNIPEGTVKSRLGVGRKQMKGALKSMEHYTENSYKPENLFVSFWGSAGMNGEPDSLVGEDLLAQNILILAYEKPVAISELSRGLGVPAAYIEPIVCRLADGELMKRMGDGKVYTDFVIYDREDYTKYVPEQEKFAEDYAEYFCGPMGRAIDALKKTDCYSERLERFLMIGIAQCMVQKCLRRNIDPSRSLSAMAKERPNGGYWIAMGNKGYVYSGKQPGREIYSLSGLRTCSCVFQDEKPLYLYNYESSLYPYGKYDGFGNMQIWDCERKLMKLLYLIKHGIAPKTVDFDERVMKRIPDLIERGILHRGEDGKPEVSVPYLTRTQFSVYESIRDKAAEEAAKLLAGPFGEFMRERKKEIPPHLKGIPEEREYYTRHPGEMMFVYEAIRRGVHKRDLGYPCPEMVMVEES